MTTEQTPLTDITKKFNPPLNSNLIENIKLRSKSTTFIKPKLYHQSSTDNMKKYEKAVLTDSKQSLLHNVSFQRRSRHQISTEIVIKEEEDQAHNIYDLYMTKLQASQVSQSKKQSQQKVSNELQSSFQCIGQLIKDMVVNENGLIALDQQGKITFRSFNGQENANLSNFISEFFKAQNIRISKVFSTSYSTFFLDDSGQIHSLGLNDRGQLGHSHLGVVNKPLKINLPFKTGSNSQRTQRVIKIVGGPFHSVILTNLNKLYYTGALYSEAQILNESFISRFTEITIKNQTIKQVECGLTSCVFLTKSNKIFIMGLFGQCHFNKTPTDIEFPIKFFIKQIKVSNDCIYVISDTGQLFKVNMNKKMPIISEIKLEQSSQNKAQLKKTSKLELHSIYCSLDKIIFVAKYYHDSISNPAFKYFTQTIRSHHDCEISIISEISFKIGFVEPYQVFIAKNSIFAVFSSDKITRKLIKNTLNSTEATQHSIQSYMDKIKALEQENLKLKQHNDFVIRQKKQKCKKIQKSPVSNINFNFQQQINPRTFIHDLQIEFSDIKLTNKIAQGGYGVIYKGEWKKTTVAIKIFKIDQNNTNSIKEFISECRAMQALRHPNIVMFLGACLKPPNFAIVLEYCQGGTLWSLLQNHQIELSWKERINLALQTAKAMNYLHDRKHPIVHRDLKSLNILLDNNRRVKLADFGWTKCLQNYMTSKIGTYQWMAPEVLTGQQYTEKADVFSYSIILWEIIAREAPYRNISGFQVAYDVANKQYRPAIPGNTPIEFKELTEKCWEKIPEKRPSFVEIIENLEKQLAHLS